MIFKRLYLLFTYGPELEDLLKKKKEERQKAEREAKAENLNLCFRHQQESSHSYYSESNCYYCRLLDKYRMLHEVLNDKDR